jgi:Skp family chaperone for outer membrane proteins
MAHAQSRGIKIGYIDMEYILQNVPDYSEAKNQLEQKAQKWKQEIETKKNEIAGLKESLATERALLTKELLEEREEEIAFQEKELNDYQEKRFGPKGDLTLQRAVLAQPVQDQVFNAAQDIAEAKKYDFILDKTSDLTILFAAKRYDISDQVLRVINRSNKRNQLTKKQLKEEEAKEAKENMEDESPALADRRKKLEEKKAQRDKLIADKKAALELKKQEQQAVKEARKNGTAAKAPAQEVAQQDKTNDSLMTKVPARKPDIKEREPKTVDSTAIIKKQKTAEERAQVLADRKKALEEKKQKALEARDAAKKARDEKKKPEGKTENQDKTN